jgi:hypothetical protein
VLADHVLLPSAGPIRDADERLAARAQAAVDESVALVPAVWLGEHPEERRQDIADFLHARLEARARSSRRRNMREPDPDARPFAYALLRVVHVDESRLAAIAPGLDPAAICGRLEAIAGIAHGDPAAGPLAQLSQSERFGWIVAPASTIIQPSHVHTGLTKDPEATLARLFELLVF